MLKQDLIIGFMFSPPNGPNRYDAICAIYTPPPLASCHLTRCSLIVPPASHIPHGRLRKARRAGQSDKGEGFSVGSTNRTVPNLSTPHGCIKMKRLEKLQALSETFK